MKTLYNPNLLVNGDFADGIYTSTASVSLSPGTPPVTLVNNNVPVGWVGSPGFDFPGFNGVYDDAAGNPTLIIGNDPGYALASISQSFADVAGKTYTVSFDISNVTQYGSFTAALDGATQLTIAGIVPAVGESPYTFTTTWADGKVVTTMVGSSEAPTLETFTFVGTGNDTLTLTGENDASSFTVSDVSVTAVSPTYVNVPARLTAPNLPKSDDVIVASDTVHQVLSGGSVGVDVFQFDGGGHVNDTITDWRASDKIEFRPLTVAEFLNAGTKVNVYAENGGAMVVYDNNSVLLAGISPTSLTQGNFLLPKGYTDTLVVHGA